MAKRNGVPAGRKRRRRYTQEFKQEAVQMLLDGHSAKSVAENLGISHPNILHRWKAQLVTEGGPVAEALDSEVRELRDELERVRRERDILKKALTMFSRQQP